MRNVPVALIMELEGKGFAHIGGRLFRRNSNYYLLHDELDTAGRVLWSIRESWAAIEGVQPLAAE